MKSILVLGCGSTPLTFTEPASITTLDINPDHHPDVVHDLESLPYPFADSFFDEVLALEVLEHTGAQGDYKFFFAQFTELHRILKPNGFLTATVPTHDSLWAWGDPSHRRVINAGTLVFLSQRQYEAQVGKTAMSDFRHIYKADFEPVRQQTLANTFSFTLQAIKS